MRILVLLSAFVAIVDYPGAAADPLLVATDRGAVPVSRRVRRACACN
jgi:hypothetical protein